MQEDMSLPLPLHCLISVIFWEMLVILARLMFSMSSTEVDWGDEDEGKGSEGRIAGWDDGEVEVLLLE